MPLHRRADGTTVAIPWPPPKETNIKIHTRLVATESASKSEVGQIDEQTGWGLKNLESESENRNHKTSVFRHIRDDGPIIDEDEYKSAANSNGWMGGILRNPGIEPAQEEEDDEVSCSGMVD
jgi:hypothetical protein